MSKRDQQNRLFAYLEARGVLANGTPEEIIAAKRDYRRDYERRYKRGYRLRHSEVRFTLDHQERRLLLATAEAAGKDSGTYAKEATIALLRGNRCVTPVMDREALQIMSLIHSEVRHLCRQRPTGFLERRVAFDQLQTRIDKLETLLREKLSKAI